MINTVKAVVGIFCILMLSSCSDRVSKFYDFDLIHYEVESGELYIMLQGKYSNEDTEDRKLTLRTNPYTLVIGLHTNDKHVSEFRLSNVSLCEQATSVCKELPDKAKGVKSPSNQYAYIMNIAYRDLEIDYLPHRVIASLEIVVDGEVRVHTISQVISTKYSEEKSSDFWDRLGSV